MIVKRILIVAGVALLALILASTAFAGGWDEKVTGGGQARSGGTDFSITVSAWDDGAGNAAGQIQYSAPSLSFHATVQCLYLAAGEAVAAGPATAQDDPGSWVDPSMWIIVNIKEGGIGAGDSVRVYQDTPANAELSCTSGPVLGFPGDVYDGNFNLREK